MFCLVAHPSLRSRLRPILAPKPFLGFLFRSKGGFPYTLPHSPRGYNHGLMPKGLRRIQGGSAAEECDQVLGGGLGRNCQR